MSVSIVDPVTPAIAWTGKLLFKPFDVAKWLVLGFCAWLAYLGERGGGYNSRWQDSEAGEVFRESVDWSFAHLALVLYIGAVLLVLMVAVIVVMTWVSSRGKFLFLDNVLRNRAAVVEPWQRLRGLGNSLFGFRLLLILAGMALFGLLIAATLGLLWPAIENDGLTAYAIVVGLSAAGAMFLFVVLLTLIQLAINDLVVPVMYVRGCGVGPAWTEALALLSAHAGTFVLYVLFRILIALLGAAVMFMAVFCTCCLVAVPYLGTVLMLPFYVFVRSYSLCFLGQFGPQFGPFAEIKQPANAA